MPVLFFAHEYIFMSDMLIYSGAAVINIAAFGIYQYTFPFVRHKVTEVATKHWQTKSSTARLSRQSEELSNYYTKFLLLLFFANIQFEKNTSLVSIINLFIYFMTRSVVSLYLLIKVVSTDT